MNSLNSKLNTKNRISWLLSDTSDQWIKQANSDPLQLLLDHAHCERKAAGVALQLMFRYASEPGLSEVLSPIVREELEHFELVLGILKSRGRDIKLLPAPPYGSLLAKNIRNSEPQRMLDSFLIAGLIEARSHERMYLLSLHSKDHELRGLYENLLRSEARHFCVYRKLAEERFQKDEIDIRLKELSIVESQILTNLYPFPRMHS